MAVSFFFYGRVVLCVCIYITFSACMYVCVCVKIYHIFIHSFHILAILLIMLLWTWCVLCFWISVVFFFFWYIPRSGIDGSYGSSVFLNLRNFHYQVCVCACVVAQSCTTLWSHGLYSARFLCPWAFPSKNTRAGCHFLFQGIFLTQGLNPDLCVS